MISLIDKIKKLSVTLRGTLSFLNRNESDNNKAILKDSSAENVAGRDINLNTQNSWNIPPSKIEKLILKFLLKNYENTDLMGFNFYDTCNQLEINPNRDWSVVHDSQYLEISGKNIKMKPDGLRYIENLPDREMIQIRLPHERRAAELATEMQRKNMERNRAIKSKNTYI